MTYEIPAALTGSFITATVTFVVFVLTQITSYCTKRSDFYIAKLEQLLLACINLASSSKIIARGNPINLSQEANSHVFIYYKNMSDIRALINLHFAEHADLFNPVLEHAGKVLSYYSATSKGEIIDFPNEDARKLGSLVHDLIDVTTVEKDRFIKSMSYYFRKIME